MSSCLSVLRVSTWALRTGGMHCWWLVLISVGTSDLNSSSGKFAVGYGLDPRSPKEICGSLTLGCPCFPCFILHCSSGHLDPAGNLPEVLKVTAHLTPPHHPHHLQAGPYLPVDVQPTALHVCRRCVSAGLCNDHL